ncbi:MAG: hypothetical protein ACR2F9_01290 [Longimicrobiaceae bacterium]
MNLDWLLVALLLLPFAARLFGGGAKPQSPPGDGAEPTEGGEGWSAGWSEWPEELPGEADGSRSAARFEAAPSDVAPSEPPPREARPSRPVKVRRGASGRRAAAETVPAPPPPPEPNEIDRAAEHERLHRRRAATGARRGAAPAPLMLGDRAALRRAIVLREVLGPPRALQPLDGERA